MGWRWRRSQELEEAPIRGPLKALGCLSLWYLRPRKSQLRVAWNREGTCLQHQGGKPAGFTSALLQCHHPLCVPRGDWPSRAGNQEKHSHGLTCPLCAHVLWWETFIFTEVLAGDGPVLREFTCWRGNPTRSQLVLLSQPLHQAIASQVTLSEAATVTKVQRIFKNASSFRIVLSSPETPVVRCRRREGQFSLRDLMGSFLAAPHSAGLTKWLCSRPCSRWLWK